MKTSDFRHFYDCHFDRVYRFVFFRVGNNEEVAQDVTSEIFMKALGAFANYDPKRSQTAWIMTIARNHVINHWRDRKETVDIDKLVFSLEGDDGRTVEETRDDIRTLQVALESLPPKDKRLIELKYILGYKYGEIAEELGKSTGAVRIETHRAMKKLKQDMQSLYEED